MAVDSFIVEVGGELIEFEIRGDDLSRAGAAERVADALEEEFNDAALSATRLTYESA